MNDSMNWQSSGEATTEQQAGSNVDIWGMLSRRKWIIILGVICGLGVGYLQFTKSESVFTSSAKLLVELTNHNMPIDGVMVNGGAKSDHIINDLEILKSSVFLTEAAKAKDMPPFRGRFRPSRANDNPNVIVLTYTSKDRVECRVALQAIIDHYIEYVAESQRSESHKTMQLITDAKNTLDKELKERETAYQKFRESSNLIWGNESATNPYQNRLALIENERSRLSIERSTTKAELEAIEAAMARGANREAMMMMIDKISKQSMQSEKGEYNAAQSMTSRLYPYLLERQTLLETLGQEHPKVVAIDKKIEFARSMYQQQLDENNKGKLAPKKTLDLLAIYLNSLRQEINSSIQKEKELNELFKQEKIKARQLASEEMLYENLSTSVKRTERLFESIVSRVEQMSLVKDVGGKTVNITLPPHRGSEVSADLARALGMGGMGGFAIGLVLAFLIEMADKTYRSPQEIFTDLHFPVVGHIPTLPLDDLGFNLRSHHVDSTVCTYHQPRSRLSEAYRAVRTALFFNTRGKGHQVIQVTSPTPGDGKSTLCANLATAIAQSGKKCLIVDADLRRPRVHTLFGADRSIGVTSFIAGGFELSDVVQSTEVENLWCLPSGPRPDDPSELLTSPRFEKLLELLRQKYDFVLIDTPPLLAVTDPGAVAARADGVILTLRVNNKTRKTAKRSAELLNQVGAHVMGIVVNGVGSINGYNDGYGTSNSSYNASSYSYGYGSSDYSEYSEYYANDTEDGIELDSLNRSSNTKRLSKLGK